ncbi:MAG: hypothetical protein SFX73_04685 [Kofleriaceae bacterium]|nr:hypothetical protein [Kofleriaceae bacterium]
MRTLSSVLFVGLVISSGAGCKWTDFDDLEAEAWVTSTEKPNTASTDFGIALARGSRSSTNGGTLVAIASGKPQYLELGYAANGDVDASNTLMLETVSAVQTFDQQPIVISDPASDEVSLVAASAAGGIAVLHGAGGLGLHSIGGPAQVDAATYMLPPPSGNNPSPVTAPLVGAIDSVYGSFFTQGTAPSMLKCQLLDGVGGMPVQIRGLGAARITSTTADDVVVWGTIGPSPSDSWVFIYSGDVFNGNAGTCAGGTATPLASANITFVPGLGSQIIMVDATHALLAGHGDGADSYIALWDVSPNAGVAQTPTIIGDAVTLPNLRTATVLDLDAQKYVFAGYPNDVVEGVKAGRVLGLPLTLTTGVGAVPALELHDAQPEEDQVYGRALAVTQFNGKPVLAVAADNEVFMYFRTTLYDETRDK